MSKIYDAIIVGGGPAGLSAAIYLSRAKYSVLVLEKEKFGGQITITSDIVNYPGVLEDSGESLTQKMRQQAQNFGATFQKATVKKLLLDQPIKKIETDQGTFETIGLVLATGAHPRQLGFPGEKEYQGRGIAYCATCDGEFFEGCQLFVIGGGFAACEEAIFLTQYASKVTMIVREEDFTCAKTIADEVRAHDKIEIIFETEIIEAGGSDTLEYAVFRNNKDQSTWRYDAKNGRFGIFVFAGYVPENALFKDQLKVNPQGYLLTDRHQKTSQDGVYGAGDICEKDLRQVVTAVSDGAIAATSLEKYITSTKEKYHIETVAYYNKTDIKKSSHNNDSQTFISDDIRQQLKPIFNKLTKDIYLIGQLGDDRFSLEIKNFMEEISSLSGHIHVEYQALEDEIQMKLCNDRKQDLGVHYHMIPGGHEFNSFILAIYNAGCQGQALEQEVLDRIKTLDSHRIQVFVSLSCTMCPEVVQATQRIALLNQNIQTSIYDLSHFPQYKDQYHIMSVPCIVIDQKEVLFGKKNLEDMLEIIEKLQ